MNLWPTMKWFGYSWGAPINRDCPQVPVPVGEHCLWCAEVILADETGVIYSNGPAAHIECFLRQTFGSVGHQLGLCSCPGNAGIMDDPPGLSRRQAALAAVEEFERSHAQ
jgi:hypothetical protein